MKKKRKPNKYQILIEKFCKDPSSIWSNRGKVKAEMAVAKKLYKLNSSESFWVKLYLPFKLNSLCWFLTSKGKSFLRLEQKRQKLDLKPKTSYSLGESKLGGDKKIIRKIKTLKDFLKQDVKS